MPNEENLEERLDTGWAMIEQAEAEGRHGDVARLTAHWLHLLQRYEEREQQARRQPPPVPRQNRIW